jgi:hypothetical protein
MTPNAWPEPRPEAGAKHEGLLEAVGGSGLFGADLARESQGDRANPRFCSPWT